MPHAIASNGPDGRDAGQRARIRPSRDVDRDAVSREDVGDAVIGEPAAIFDAGRVELVERLLRDTERHRRALSARAPAPGSMRNSRISSVRSSSPQLPTQTRSPSFSAARGSGWKTRVSAASCQVHAALRPAILQVEVADHAAVGEDAVVVREVVGGHRAGVGHAAVVRVVEEQAVVVARRDARRCSAPARAGSTRARSRHPRRRALRRDRASSRS